MTPTPPPALDDAALDALVRELRDLRISRWNMRIDAADAITALRQRVRELEQANAGLRIGIDTWADTAHRAQSRSAAPIAPDVEAMAQMIGPRRPTQVGEEMRPTLTGEILAQAAAMLRDLAAENARLEMNLMSLGGAHATMLTELAAARAEAEAARRTLQSVRIAIVSVLCDHDERPCFTGTDADRNVIGAALTDIDAAIDAARGPGGR